MSETAETQGRDPRFEEAKQHLREARQSMRKSIEAWLPAGFVEHRRAARKEFLLAMRSLVDAAIDRVSEEQKPGA